MEEVAVDSEGNKKMLDWVEAQAERNMAFRIESIDRVSSEANVTLSVLLAGGGGCFYLAVDKWGVDRALAISLLACTVYLFVLAAALICTCLRLCDVQAPTNEPKNLYQPESTLDEIRAIELENIQQRITFNADRGNGAASRLNVVRIAAFATPIIFLLAWMVAA